jgi:hypothetical protein
MPPASSPACSRHRSATPTISAFLRILLIGLQASAPERSREETKR